MTTRNTGPQLVFEGQVAGTKASLTGKRHGGDANSPFDYTLYCSCLVAEGERKGHATCLGPLGRFIPNESGSRTAYCPDCGHVTIIDKEGQLVLHAPFSGSLLKTG